MTNEQVTIFRSVSLMQALAENLDDLKHTRFYRQEMKNRLNHLRGDLSLYLRTLSETFWGEDEEIMMHISRGIDKVTEALATWHPAQMAVLEQVLNDVEKQFNEAIKQEENEQVPETAEPAGH